MENNIKYKKPNRIGDPLIEGHMLAGKSKDGVHGKHVFRSRLYDSKKNILLIFICVAIGFFYLVTKDVGFDFGLLLFLICGMTLLYVYFFAGASVIVIEGDKMIVTIGRDEYEFDLREVQFSYNKEKHKITYSTEQEDFVEDWNPKGLVAMDLIKDDFYDYDNILSFLTENNLINYFYTGDRNPLKTSV